MFEIIQINTRDRRQVRDFIEFQYDHYKDCEYFVPPFRNDIKTMMNIPTLFDPKGHPFYDHSESAFFVAYQDGKVVGRIAVFDNVLYNQHHGSQVLGFTLFESINDQAVANGLFEAGFEWGRARGLNLAIGEKGFSSFDGYGILVEGFDLPQSMTMSKYNYPYYKDLFEHAGFEMEVDFNTFQLPGGFENFNIPERVQEISNKVQERGFLTASPFKDKKELIEVARTELIAMYKTTFETNWEYYPWTDAELNFAINQVLLVADPNLIKAVRTRTGEMVGFLIGFPDLTKEMQAAKGRITPWGMMTLMRAAKTNRKNLILNGAGILPKYQGRGGNALMYTEMKKTAQDYGFEDVEICQIAETTKKMRSDMEKNLGVEVRKIHRVYRKNF
ncbi:MAG: hypothetical protein V2J07_10775 [Anaerolineae bacterium]|jgi:hypothetical protein|nr:hypothetical protein [Anaerolineae bacterium]